MSLGDFIAARTFYVKNGEMALGQTQSLPTWHVEGYNFEDAVIMSERLVRRRYTSVHPKNTNQKTRDTKPGPGRNHQTLVKMP